jgi:hypothetical protein
MPKYISLYYAELDKTALIDQRQRTKSQLDIRRKKEQRVLKADEDLYTIAPPFDASLWKTDPELRIALPTHTR